MSAPTRPRGRGDRPRVALVLSGGGARGAYEAGVLRYLREDLAGDLGGQVQFDIISGTSVGGIHACFVAGTCDMAAKQGRMLVRPLGELRPRGDGRLRREGFPARARDAARQRQGRGVRWPAPPGRHRADAAARARGAPPDPLEPHQQQLQPGAVRVALGDSDRHRLRKERGVRAAHRGWHPRVEQGPLRARAGGDHRSRARAGVGRAADPVPRRGRRRALLLRRRPAPEHAAVAGAAPGRRQGAGDRAAPQAPARGRRRARGVDALPGRRVSRRQGAGRVPARSHRLRPGSPAALQRAHHRGARVRAARSTHVASTRW